MGTVDVYRITDELDEDTLDVLLTRLESRGKDPRFREDDAGLPRCHGASTQLKSVLDLGCGSGVATRAIALGRVFEVESRRSTAVRVLIAAARRLANEAGVGGVLDFRLGDSHRLAIHGRRL